MPKFKVGDKIEFEMDGKKVSGTITRDYNSPDHAMYDVRVGAKTMTIADTPMHPANACKNAKFRVGDKVTYWVFDKKLDGSVKAVRGERVDIDDGHGGVVTFKAKDLEVWNARACNAKFIKGDFVKVKGWPGTFRIDIVNPDGTYVLKKYPSGQPTIGSYKESELELEEANAKACNSRNPIVAKALNACARNARIESLIPKDLIPKFRQTRADIILKERLESGKPIKSIIKSFLDDKKISSPEWQSELDKAIEILKEMEKRGVKSVNACGTARNAVTITLDSRKRDGWVTGKVNGYDFEAKVFDEGSDFGIKSGRVSKLWMRKGDETVNYDRGWDRRPESAEAKAAYTELLRKMESLPKVMNACGTARNGSLGEDAALGISYAREAVAKLNSAVPLIEKWIASGKGHPNAVADGKRLVNGIKKAVAILNPVV